MNDALTIIKYLFTKFINLFFNDFSIFSNVSLGWVMVSIFIISIMISNILSLARSSISFKSKDKTVSRGFFADNEDL